MKKDYERSCIFCGKSPIAVKIAKGKQILRCMTCGKIQQKGNS